MWPFKKQAPSIPGMTVEEIRVSRERGIEFVARHPELAHFSAAVGRFFHEVGGINFVEVSYWSEEFGEMVMTVQRKAGETPANQITRLKARIAELEARNDST